LDFPDDPVQFQLSIFNFQMTQSSLYLPNHESVTDDWETSLSESELSPDSSRITVLLVDDQPFIGKIIGRMLKSEKDIDFHYFQSARDALRIGKEISPTVILQDLVMPEISGLNMVYYFRAKENTRDIPLIVLSADENAKVKAEAFAVGANDYIVKPPDKIELIARIRYHSQAYINMLQRDEAYRKLERQTAELQNSNESLLKHIAERKRTETELRESKKKVEAEREAAETANKKIMSSIRYAQTIQQSFLPNPGNMKTFLPETFLIWMPRDIVGGDFIFTHRLENRAVIAVLDCTGHGVPGAFMTMVASFGLEKIVKGEGWYDPANILKRLNFLVKTSLQQDTAYALSDDGLDAAVCLISQSETSGEQNLTFAGAKLPLFYTDKREVTVIKGDKMSLGYRKSDLNFSFTNHTIPIRKEMFFYMLTDGFTDQLGGEKRRRFGMRRLKDILKEIAFLSVEKQKDELVRAFNEYKGENEIQDDVTVLGFGFN
jgi:serine phosphatase RsbU (regulator of sigma subunit)